MKVIHRSRYSLMAKSVHHIQDALPVLQEMGCCTMSECMYGNGRVEGRLCQGILKDGTHISRVNTLWRDILPMRLKHEVITWVPFPECAQYDEHLRGYRYIPVFVPLALAYEEHASVEAYVLPSEPAGFADPECAVVDECQQGLVVQVAALNESCNTTLGEHPGKFLELADFRQHQSLGLLKPHDLVIVLQSKYGVFKIGDAVSLLIQQGREISLNVILCEIIGQLLKMKSRLRNLELVVIDTLLSILSDTQLFVKDRDAVFKFRHNRACLVYESIRHGNFGEGEY